MKYTVNLTAYLARWLRPLANERNHQTVKHQMGNMTHIIAIFKLSEIFPEMLPADMNVGAIDRTLQLRPKAFNGVYASALRRRILSKLVIDLDVAVTRLVDVMIPAN